MTDEQKVVLVEIDIDIESAIKASADLRETIKTLDEETKAMKGTEKELSVEYAKKTAQLKNAKADLAANEKAIQKISIANNTEIGTIKRLKAENSALAAERENLNLSTQEGIDRLGEINTKLDENNELIKNSSDKFSKAKQNVGNYEESIKNALGSMDAFSGGQGNIINNFIGISQQEGGVTSFFKTFIGGIGSATKAGLAFIATPIGAVIFAIVAAIGIFTTAIKNNDEASEGFGSTWAGVSAVFDIVIERIIKLYKAFFALYTLDFKGAAKNFSEAFGGITDEVEKAYTAGQKLYALQLQLQSLQSSSVTTLAKLEAKEKALALIADDNTRSLKERMIATIELQKVQEEQARVEVEIQRKALQIAAFNLKRAKETEINVKATRDEFRKVEAEFIKAEADLTTVVAENAKKRREIRKDQLNRELDLLIDGFDSVKTINEKIIANEDETFRYREAKLAETRKLSDESFEAQIKAIERAYGKQIDQDKLLAETDARRLSRMVAEMNLADDISGRVLEIFKERKMAVSDLNEAEISIQKSKAKAALDNLDFELALYKLNNQSKLENVRVVTAEIIEAEKNRLFDIQNQELLINEQKFANGLIKEKEYNLAKKQLEVDFNSEIASIDFDFQESERERKITSEKADYENRLSLLKSNVLSELDIQSDKLARQAEAELLQAELSGAEKALIYEKWAKAEEEIERKKTEAKLQLASQFAGNIKAIAGEGTAIGKAAAIAETTINTYKAATAAYASLASIPYVGPALGATAAAAAVVAGLANVKKIIAVKNPNGGGDGGSGSLAGSGGNTSAPRASINPTIGQGIVSRDSSTGTSASVQNGIKTGMQGVSLQPVLVVDAVTAKQNQTANNNKAATI